MEFLRVHWFRWVGLIALSGYAVLIGVQATTAAGGSDSSGYLNCAQMIARGEFEIPLRLPPGIAPSQVVERFHFQPLGLHAYEDRPRMVPTYSSGFPLQVALAAKLLGWAWGVRAIVIANAVAAIALCYAIGRELGLGRALAAAGAVVLAACPLMLFAALQPLSDAPATTWCLAAVWSGLRARGHPGWAVACGASFGVAVLVRPTNVLLLPALLVLSGGQGRRLAWAVLGGLPAVAWLAFYNHTLFGGALSSGYLNWQGFFELQYVKPATWFFVRWLAVLIPAVLLVLPLATLRRADTRTPELAMLALWFLGITGLYLFCAFSHEAWNSLRYILPALPALILAGLLGIEAIARSLAERAARRLRTIAAVTLAAWAAAFSWGWTPARGVFLIRYHEDRYISAPAAARDRFPERSLLLSCYTSGALYFYTSFPILRYDAVTPAQFTQYATQAQRAGVTIGAVLFTEEEQRALREHCAGTWEQLAAVDGVQLWRLVKL